MSNKATRRVPYTHKAWSTVYRLILVFFVKNLVSCKNFKISFLLSPLRSMGPRTMYRLHPLLRPGVDMTLSHAPINIPRCLFLDLVSSESNARSKYLSLLRQHLEPAIRRTVSLSGSRTAVWKHLSGFFALKNIFGLQSNDRFQTKL